MAYADLSLAATDAVDVIRPGYKQTEVGVIPEEWLLATLGEVCAFENGDRSSNYPSPGSFVSSGVPFVNAGHVSDGEISSKGMNYITGEVYSRLSRGKLKAGDILFCIRGSLGKFGVVSVEFGEGAIASSLVIVRPRSVAICREYLGCYFGSVLCARMIETWSGGAAQPNLGVQDLAKFSIVLPPTKTEQIAVAAALSDADALIESLQHLIAKKRQIKQGAMQALLTGQQRLPGFSEEWGCKRLKDIGATFGGLTGKTKADFGSGSARYITFMNIMTNVVIDCTSFERVHVRPFESQNQVCKGDLFFNGSSETPEEVGMCSVLTNEVANVYLNSFCFGFRCHDLQSVNGKYLAYYFRSTEGRELLKSLAQGATRYNLSKRALLRVEFPCPSFEEQTAIATVLSDIDTEIAALEARLNKAHEIKQGMIQALLTGAIRLPLAGVA